MNLNQARTATGNTASSARLRKPRKIIAGYWQDEDVQARIGSWMKAAIGVAVSKNMKVMRFGDNMRNVAVTEGDKVEVQKKLGWEVNTWAVGDLVKKMNAVTEAEIDELMAVYREKYDFCDRRYRCHPLSGARRDRYEEDDGCGGLQSLLQHVPRPLWHGTAARPRVPAPHGAGLRLRRRRRLEGRSDDRHPESHGRKRQRRVRVHGGHTYHLVKGRSIPSARICWRSAVRGSPAVRASRRTSSASA